METKYLYHGSQNGDIEVLEPRISVGFNKPAVYATDDLKYAIVRAGKQDGLIREEYYGPNKPFELAECFPNAFKDMFDCTGYIYLLSSDNFEKHEGEYVSNKPVKPIGKIKIECLLNELYSNNVYDLHFYGDQEYWKNVHGGLNGFIYRKMITKILLEMDN